MGIPLTGTGGLFTRVGLTGGILNSINTYRGSTIPPKVNNLQSQFDATDQNLIDLLYTNLLNWQNASTAYLRTQRALAQTVVTQMVNEAQPQSSLTSLPVCMSYLISQMQASGQTVQACHVATSSSQASFNNGNPVITLTTKRNDGLIQENSFNDLFSGFVTNDAQSGRAILGRETISFTSSYSITDFLNWQYPQGSGASLSVTTVDANQSQGSGRQNYLNNSNFELWSTLNVPTAWHIGTGTAGVTVFQSSAQFYDGTWSLRIAGSNTEQTSLNQQFSLAFVRGDTSTIMQPVDQVGFNLFAKVDVNPASGVLEIALVDENGSITQDEQGTSNVVTQSLTTWGSVWKPINGYFRTPRVMPSAIYLRLRMSTALSSGSNLFIDHAALAEPFQLYQGGPGVMVFSGNEQLIDGDTFTLTITNDFAGQFQRLFERLYSMRTMNLLLPSSNSPTISDGLIT